MDTAAEAFAGRARSKRWTRVSRGLHRSAGADDLAAWQLALPPGGRFTHLTAAAALGWRVPPLPTGLPVVAAVDGTSSRRPERPGLRLLRSDPLGPPRTHARLRVDAPEDVLLTCARDLSILDLVVLVDGALHRGDVELATLVEVSRARRRGNRNLRAALALADGRSESAWESVLRLLHHTCDAAVEPQHEIRTPDGGFVARADLLLLGTASIHEYDGGVHLERAQQQADLRRARRLADAGWTRRGYTSHDLLRQPIGVLRDIDTALGRPHEPARVRSWYLMLRDSMVTTAGRRRILERMGR